MCFDSGNTVVQQQQLPPALMAELAPLWQRAGEQAGAAYVPYGQMTDADGKPLVDADGKPVIDPNAKRIAGFTPDQLTAFEAIRQDAAAGTPAMGAGTLADISAFQPQPAQATFLPAPQLGAASEVAAAQASRGAVRDVAGGSLGGADLSGYTNPWADSVVDTSLADLARQNAILNNQTNARAAAEGAFGGSRSAVLNSLNNEAFARQAGQLAAQLRSQGFTNAQQTAETDLTRQLQAQQSNQAADLSTSTLNAQLAQQAGLANQAAANQFAVRQAELGQQANLANESAANQVALASQQAQLGAAGLRLNAANSQAQNALAQQQYQTTAENRLAGIGSEQQGLDQQNLNLAYQDFLDQQNWPWTEMARESGILRGSPAPMTTTTTGPSPSPFGQLAGLGLAGLGLFARRDGGTVPLHLAEGGLNDLLAPVASASGGNGLADDPTADLDFVPLQDGSWTIGTGSTPVGGGGSSIGTDTSSRPLGGLDRRALIAAGLGMMASRSPNPLTQIGEGGLFGLRALGSQGHPFLPPSAPGAYGRPRRYPGGLADLAYASGGLIEDAVAAAGYSPRR